LSRKEKKISKMWWALGFAAIFSVALFALTFASALSANEASKESHVSDGTLEDLDGGAVATADVQSFAALFDLPRFDTSVLNEIKSITVAVQGDMEMTFTISDVINDMGCGSATFKSTSGASIIVDSTTGVALVKVDEETYIVESGEVENDGRALYTTGSLPQLYSSQEFFVESHGFEIVDGRARRMSGSDHVSGYAAIALQASKAVFDDVQSVRDVEYSSLYMKGTVIGGEEQGPFEIFYRNETYSKFKTVDDVTGKQHITMWLGSGFIFTYDDDNKLEKCRSSPEDLPDYQDTVNGAGALAVSQCAKLVKVDSTQVIEIEKVRLNVDFYDVIDVPTAEECQTANRADMERQIASASFEDSLGGLRGRELGSGRVGTEEMWYLSQAAYGESPPGGWREIANCAVGNSRAKGFQKGSVKVLAFEGTNMDIFNCIFGSCDWGDDLNNGNIDGYHAGFYNYAQRINGGTSSACRGIKTTDYDFVTGHSLGGAAATVWKSRGFNPGAKLVTFGAPMTSKSRGNVAGERFYHDNDPITGNPLNLFGGTRHQVNTVYHVDNERCSCHCNCRRWWGSCCGQSCSCHYIKSRQSSTKLSRWDTDYTAWWKLPWRLPEGIYHFATTHCNYQDYLPGGHDQGFYHDA